MAVLIKGMEMPKSCAGCYMFLHGIDMEGHLWQECALKERDLDDPFGIGKPDWCPLVEVPPHGRLIDADALKDNWTHKDLDLFSQGWGWLRDLNQAPTVIPAETTLENEIKIIDTKGKPNYDPKHRFVIQAEPTKEET